MTSPAPRVTIAIPLYNSAAYIGETIASILGQSFADFELLVYDDRSTDGAADIVETFKDPRLRLVRNPVNLGPEGNWNRCLSEVRGEYLKIVCGDDVMSRDCLARQVAVLDAPENVGVGVVSCSRQIIDARGRPLVARGFPGGRGRMSGKEALRRTIRRGTNLIGEPVAVLFRSALVARAGRFRALNPYLIDLDYWVRLLALADIFVIPEALCSFRISPTSWSSRIGMRQYSEFMDFVALTAKEQRGTLGFLDLRLAPIFGMVQFLGRMLFFKFLAPRGAPA